MECNIRPPWKARVYVEKVELLGPIATLCSGGKEGTKASQGTKELELPTRERKAGGIGSVSDEDEEKGVVKL